MLAMRLGTTYSAEQGLRDVNSSELLELLNWKNLAFKLNKLTLMYNILNNGTAPRLRDFFSARSDNNNNYNLRNYDTDLSIPKPKKEFLKRSFRYRGAVWNSLSYEAKTAQSIHSFKGLILINTHVIIHVIYCVGWGVFWVLGVIFIYFYFVNS